MGKTRWAWPAALAAGAVAANLLLLHMRGTAAVVNGDEGTFLAMTASLALDHDLAFDERDARRLAAFPRGGRTDVILQTTPSGIFYSKPALYPLLAAPFFRVLGDRGVVGFNIVVFGLALLAGWAYLRRSCGSRTAAMIVATFAGTSVVPAYAVWTMSDSLQAALVLAGASLCLGAERREREDTGRRTGIRLGAPGAIVIGALCLGLAAAVRYPNALIGAAVALALALERRPGRAALAVALLVAGVGLGLGLNSGLGGAAVPYKTLRATFTPETGYPVGEDAEQAMDQFRAGEATQRVGLKPRLSLRMSAWSGLYSLIGRHTGILVYFPFALFLVVAAVRRPDARAVLLTGAAAGTALFYLLWLPWNYFGGATFLGNRYFLTGYSALLLAPRQLPAKASLRASWALASVVFASALVSTAGTRDSDGTSQMHAHAGIFRLLPYETTARDLDGRRDRYWSDEFIRFVDPYARVRRLGFQLTAGSPAAEILLANARDFGVIRLLVATDDEGGRLEYHDWRRKETITLPKAIRGAGGLVEIVPSRSLRRHAFGWDESRTPLFARVFRLRFVGAPGSTAEIRFLGPYRLVPRFYRGESPGLELERSRVAGSRETVRLEIWNRGRRYWDSEDAVPIQFGYRLYRIPLSPGDEPLRSRLAALPARIEPGASDSALIEVRWPTSPGRYEVAFDLAIGGVMWFSEWCGAPLVTRQVTIEPAADLLERPGEHGSLSAAATASDS